MNVERIPVAQTTSDTKTAAANTAVVITYAAAAATRHVVEGIVCSYSGGTPAGGNLKIEDGAGTTIFQVDIVASGPVIIPLPVPLLGSNNTALIITLAAGGASIVGKLNVQHRVV